MSISTAKLTNLNKAANSYKLPPQLVECLIASGYDCISSVSAITELTTIEKFFRTNSHIYSQEEINRIYGRFASDPERFCFLPGHQTQLKGFIEYCRRYNKEGKGSVTLAGFAADKPPKRQKQLNRARPVKLIKAEDKLAQLAQEALNPQSDGCQHSSVDYDILQSQDDTELVVPIMASDNNTYPSQEQGESLAEVFKRLQNRIKNWCMTNQYEEIKQLKFRTDYDIHINPVYDTASQEDREKSLRLEEHFGCQVQVTCMACNRFIRLHPQRGGFCTSNVFRHFTSCRLKKPKRLSENTGMIQFLIREASEIQEIQSNDEVEIHEEVTEEEPQEIEGELSETTIGAVEQMIYVQSVDGERDETVSIEVVQGSDTVVEEEEQCQ